ncbi:hypothetical protein KQR57_05315 [Bacillus inaquosorum]|nr:hypothetical protein [Bacillus inaquosorum]
MAPIWHKQPVDPDKEKEKAPYEQRIVLFCGFEQAPGTSMVKHTDYRWLQSEKVGAQNGILILQIRYSTNGNP